MKEYQFESFDAKSLSVYEYSPHTEPVGMVQILHGMAEHFGRYESFCRALAEKGFIVFGDDHRGHGKTDIDNLGKEMEEDIFEETLSDAASLSKKYKDEHPELKLILFGHSYGSFLAQSYLSSSFNRFIDGAILSGSSFLRCPEFYLGSALSCIQCFFKGKDSPAKLIKKQSFGKYEKKLKGSFISSLEDEAKAYEDDELCGGEMSAGFYRSMFRGGRRNYKKSKTALLDKKTPILLISGSDDPVGKYGKGVERLAKYYRDSGVEDVKLVLLSGSRHEFLNDIGREEGLGHIFNFCFENTK